MAASDSARLRDDQGIQIAADRFRRGVPEEVGEGRIAADNPVLEVEGDDRHRAVVDHGFGVLPLAFALLLTRSAGKVLALQLGRALVDDLLQPGGELGQLGAAQAGHGGHQPGHDRRQVQEPEQRLGAVQARHRRSGEREIQHAQSEENPGDGRRKSKQDTVG